MEKRDFPSEWTATDQEIIEHLLLPQESNELRAPSHPPPSYISALYESSGATLGSSGTTSTSRQSNNPNATTHTMSTIPSARSRLSDEARRAKHREVQRRFIQRKKEQLQQVKQLASQLEKKLEFLQATSQKIALEEENAQLQMQCEASNRMPSNDEINLNLEEEIACAQAHFDPISDTECAEVIRRTLAEIDSASHDLTFQSLGFNLMGWNDRRKIENSTLKFIMSKEFPHMCAVTFLNDTWAKIISPRHYAKFFSPSLHIKMGILQHINDNVVIMYRVIYNPQTRAKSRSVEMFCRMRLNNGYVLFSQSLEAPSVERVIGSIYQWTRVTTWLQYTPLTTDDADGCRFGYGGCFRRIAAASLKYWLMEVFFIVLRFESVMTKPIFMICEE